MCEDGYRRRRSTLAVLRAGYLTMFAHFGYAYILNHNVKIVREQINRPAEKLLDDPIVVLTITAMPVEPPAVGFVSSPAELRSFLVFLRFTAEGGARDFAVILPGFEQDGDLYGSWANQEFPWKDQKIRLIPYTPEALSDPSYVLAIWRELSGEEGSA